MEFDFNLELEDWNKGNTSTRMVWKGNVGGRGVWGGGGSTWWSSRREESALDVLLEFAELLLGKQGFFPCSVSLLDSIIEPVHQVCLHACC